MTPFGNALSEFRRSRKLQQRELAEQTDVIPSYISALESGAKGPPSEQVLQKIYTALNLSCEEIQKLEATIAPSKRNLKLPVSASLEEYNFFWKLRQRIGSLSNEELAIMTNALSLGDAAKK
jgi:transcriptional regulator with XRE-family HTH domain